MGLDMYLAVEGGSDPKRVRELVDAATNDDGSPRFRATWYDGGPAYALGDDDDDDPILAYWRKANAVHGWIVRELAAGVDECQRIPITQQQMQDLHDRCKAVIDPLPAGAMEPDKTGRKPKVELTEDDLAGLAERAEEQGLMPTPGFFFGSYGIDVWFAVDLKDTVEQLAAIFATKGLGEASFVYQASW